MYLGLTAHCNNHSVIKLNGQWVNLIKLESLNLRQNHFTRYESMKILVLNRTYSSLISFILYYFSRGSGEKLYVDSFLFILTLF